MNSRPARPGYEKPMGNEKPMDASSRYQDSLPVTSDRLLAQLKADGFVFDRLDHAPLRTVEESKNVRDGFLSADEGGGHIKNLFLRDRKKNNYLVVLPEDRDITLTAVAAGIGAGRLSFGSAERLLEFLGVRPGAVTPLAMITGVAHGVGLFLDRSLTNARLIYMHPLVNDRTIALTPVDLERFLKTVRADYHWIDF